MQIDDLDGIHRQYLICIWEKTEGDLNASASMFDIGEAVGLDRDASSQVAEELLGFQYLEVRTLSGGIALTEEGSQAALQLGANGSGAGISGNASSLGNAPLLTETEQRTVEKLTARLKTQAGEQSWNFDALMELMADLKTIDAQLASPRPKTEIIRECLRSVLGVLKVAGDGEMNAVVKMLVGE